MNTKKESGHAINVANFKQGIEHCITCGDKFKPFVETLTIDQLNKKYDAGYASLRHLIDAERAFDEVSIQRRDAFEDLRPFSTRLLNTLASMKPGTSIMNDAKGFNRKIQGQRAEPKPKKKTTEPGTKDLDDETVSASQRSYVQLTQHFAGYIALVKTLPAYKPNEIDLTHASLAGRLGQMETANDMVAEKYAEYKQAIIERDVELYAPDTGLVDTSKALKNYLLSAMGTDSPEFKQVKSLRFKKPGKRKKTTVS